MTPPGPPPHISVGSMGIVIKPAPAIPQTPKSEAQIQEIMWPLLRHLPATYHVNKAWPLSGLLKLIEEVIRVRCNEGLAGQALWEKVMERVGQWMPEKSERCMVAKWEKVREFVGFDERIGWGSREGSEIESGSGSGDWEEGEKLVLSEQ